MGIEDIQISEELETNAPSIKYSGNEGPKSPQEMEKMMMAQLEEEYLKYVDDMMEQGMEPMTLEQFLDQAMAEGQMSGGQPLPQDPTKPVNPFQPKPTGPVLPDRQMAAYGGIMGLDGRKQYGIGSWFQKNIMDPIKGSTLGKTATAAAATYLGNKYLPEKYGGGKLNDFFGTIGETIGTGKDKIVELLGTQTNTKDPKSKTYGQTILSSIGKNVVPILGGLTAGLFTKNQEGENVNPGTPNDQTGINLADYKKAANLLDQKQSMAGNFNFAPTVASRKYSPEEMTITYANAAEGGRIGFNMGGGADMGSPQMYAAEAKEEAATKIMQKIEDPNLTDEDRTFLQEQLQNFMSQKQMPMMGIEQIPMMAMGGRIGFKYGKTYKDATEREKLKEILKNQDIIGLDNYSTEELMSLINKAFTRPDRRMNLRPGRAEGGIMDLGGMEKDYRAEGGFVPIGREEKADDVPARLSVNEFVFTADAVRNAGGGDIDQGAQVMENMMKHLEQGGQVSEESQGMAGARDMFATSQRLSEVI